ncbi:hypothetical protein BOTCAL_1345g00010 [Botryotinia calthae]|uniref:Uncharacterized protein n=1 Tax=Botryotinia calthae TaxID=38488 RepID=A0A4Y8CEX9_9HELO|nr:hypothetical protein BOTCAL_1345g00010 [Botryotinia calthae]
MDGTIIENDDDDADTFTVLVGQLLLNPFAVCISDDQQSPKQFENSRENDHLGGEAGLYDRLCLSLSGSLQIASLTILKPGGNGGMGVSDPGVEAVQDLEAMVLWSDSLLEYSKEDDRLEAMDVELIGVLVDVFRVEYESDLDVLLVDYLF